MNLKLINTHKDYLLLVDKYIKPEGKIYTCVDRDNNIYTGYTITDLEYYNCVPIIAHLPLNNAPVLEGVPLLPELPKQEDDVEFDLDAELTKLNTPSRYNGVLKRYDYTESDIKKLFDKVNTKRSDEDMPAIINQFFIDFKDSGEHWQTWDEIVAWWDKYKQKQQSLSPVKLPVEFEPEYDNVTYFDTEYQEEMERDKSQWKLKIINNILQGRWVL